MSTQFPTLSAIMCRLGMLIILLVAASVCSRRTPFFRRDYTYFEELGAFYKFHWGSGDCDWVKSFETCVDEGGRLFYPRHQHEWTVIKNLTSAAVEANLTEMFVGLHDDFHVGEFVTVDGSSTPYPILTDEATEFTPENRCVLLNIETEVYSVSSCSEPQQNRPFICKKVDDIEPCPTIDRGYHYEKSLNKCYKINNRQKTWHEAYKTCFMEGATLLVADDVNEFQFIKNHLSQLPSSDRSRACYIGFYRIEPNGVFYTVNGDRLDDIGFQIWYDKTRDSASDCGVIEQDGYNGEYYFKTQPCQIENYFICEMKANGV